MIRAVPCTVTCAGSSLMHRLILAMLLLATGPTAASAADDFPYGSSLSFAAVRNGQTIGHHKKK